MTIYTQTSPHVLTISNSAIPYEPKRVIFIQITTEKKKIYFSLQSQRDRVHHGNEGMVAEVRNWLIMFHSWDFNLKAAFDSIIKTEDDSDDSAPG